MEARNAFGGYRLVEKLSTVHLGTRLEAPGTCPIMPSQPSVRARALKCATSWGRPTPLHGVHADAEPGWCSLTQSEPNIRGHLGPKGALRGPMRSSRWWARNSQPIWALASFERCPAQCANVLRPQSPPIQNGHGCVDVSGMLARRVPWGEAPTLTRWKRARSWRIQGPRSFSNVLRLAHEPNKKLEPELYAPTSTF